MRQLYLTQAEYDTIMHALDIMESDYSYSEKEEKWAKKLADKVRAKAYKLLRARILTREKDSK